MISNRRKMKLGQFWIEIECDSVLYCDTIAVLIK